MILKFNYVINRTESRRFEIARFGIVLCPRRKGAVRVAVSASARMESKNGGTPSLGELMVARVRYARAELFVSQFMECHVIYVRHHL